MCAGGGVGSEGVGERHTQPDLCACVSDSLFYYSACTLVGFLLVLSNSLHVKVAISPGIKRGLPSVRLSKNREGLENWHTG